jgi:glutathione S-transferase
LVWRNRRTGLSAWYDAIAARPSFQSTVPPSL